MKKECYDCKKVFDIEDSMFCAFCGSSDIGVIGILEPKKEEPESTLITKEMQEKFPCCQECSHEWEEHFEGCSHEHCTCKYSRALCEECERDMQLGLGCQYPEIKINGKWYKRFTYGFDENDFRKCHDCGRNEGYHHANCDVERCPRCKGQLLSCECKVSEVRK